MNQRLRNVTADILIGFVVVVVTLWVLRGVFRLIVWGTTAVLAVIVIAFAMRIASKLRS